MNELVKHSGLQPASFDDGKRKDTYAIQLVIDLLKRKIKTGTPVTIDDIRGIHADYSMKRDLHRAGYKYENGQWIKAKTKQEWLDNWSSQYRAIPWFKTQLGAAILKGRLLVIPVIDLEEQPKIEQ